MKIVICDKANNLYPICIQEKEYIHNLYPDWIVDIYAYTGDRQELLDVIEDADAIITTYLRFDRDMLEKMKNVKCISINATGYGNVDVNFATKRGIGVVAVEEYCSQEVAEHTISVIMALNRHLKEYSRRVDRDYKWKYELEIPPIRMKGQSIGLFGLGRIGCLTAKYAQALGMQVYAYKSKNHSVKKMPGVVYTTKDEIYEKCSVIVNHMSAQSDNQYFFDDEAFQKMKAFPLFINMGRGSAVSEKALINALNKKKIRGAALDVLESENPELALSLLVDQDNVILTPHAAFYSEESMCMLKKKACNNLIFYLMESWEKISKLINVEVIHNKKGSE